MEGQKPESKGRDLKGRVLRAGDLVGYQDGAIVSREIISGEKGTITVFSFDAGEGLSEHTAPFDAVVSILEGRARVIIAGETFRLGPGEMIIMPAGIPHAVKADERFKMLLTLIRQP
ncbi:MAG: cupin [Candidatus Solincola sediminis]|uniref:Cupin n=1 Tax=Candidatus Solincola sediminis TaxID=1797199 RepID=A0A1F2WKW3_9ACTN|nr:MAG: cupin [Candidatus Solincola sediminis]